MSQLRITLQRSLIGCSRDQKDTAHALGLRRPRQTSVRPDNPAVRGMIEKIDHVLSVEQIDEDQG